MLSNLSALITHALPILAKAQKAVEAVKWALAISGIAAAAAIAIALFHDPIVAVLGIMIMLVFMATFFLFAKYSDNPDPFVKGLARVLFVSCLVGFVASGFCMLSSVFFNGPLPIRDRLFPPTTVPPPLTSENRGLTLDDVEAELPEDDSMRGDLAQNIREKNQSLPAGQSAERLITLFFEPRMEVGYSIFMKFQLLQFPRNSVGSVRLRLRTAPSGADIRRENGKAYLDWVQPHDKRAIVYQISDRGSIRERLRSSSDDFLFNLEEGRTIAVVAAYGEPIFSKTQSNVNQGNNWFAVEVSDYVNPVDKGIKYAFAIKSKQSSIALLHRYSFRPDVVDKSIPASVRASFTALSESESSWTDIVTPSVLTLIVKIAQRAQKDFSAKARNAGMDSPASQSAFRQFLSELPIQHGWITDVRPVQREDICYITGQK